MTNETFTRKVLPFLKIKYFEGKEHQVVFDEIEKFHKEDNLLSIHRGHEINNSNVTWILKPIDGTENFLNGYPHFSISLCAKIDDEIVSSYEDLRIERNGNSLGASKKTGKSNQKWFLIPSIFGKIIPSKCS